MFHFFFIFFLYFKSNSQSNKTSFSSLIEFGIVELPGQLDISDNSFDTVRYFQSTGALVYVIDCQTEYMGALQNLVKVIEMAVSLNPNINIEVLIHKIDGLSDDFRSDTQRDIIQRTTDELSDAGLGNIKIAFFLTSIYDRSIHEAFSRIVQRLIPEVPTLENMLNTLCVHSGIEKAFLFDMSSKIYVATDNSPVEPQTYEICSDFIDVTTDIDSLYYGRNYIQAATAAAAASENSTSKTKQLQHKSLNNNNYNNENSNTQEINTNNNDPNNTTPHQHPQNSHVQSPNSSALTSPLSNAQQQQQQQRQASSSSSTSSTSSSASTSSSTAAAMAAASAAASVIGTPPQLIKSISKMNNGIVLYMCQMIRGLALVGFIRSETIQKMALIDYNVEIFSQGLQRIWPQYRYT